VRQILWHARRQLLGAIPIVESWETRRGVFFLQHVVIVRLHALHLDPTVDIFVVFTRCKQIVAIVLYVCLKETLSIGFPWLSKVIAQQSTGTGV